ncbi:MAG: diguanylate cyclase [Clostridia bacterium]|nr:diguanylate cyclase [Clostridia bacterium]
MFQQFKAQLSLINCVQCGMFCLFGVVMCALLSLLSCMLPVMRPGRIAYLALFALCVLGRLLCALTIRRQRDFPVLLYYALLFFAFLAMIYLSVFAYADGNNAVTCTLLVASALFILDEPGRLTLFYGVITLLFCACAVLQKGYEAALLDCVSGVAFFVLACFISRYHIKNRLQELRYQTRIKRQRDTDGLTRLYTRGAAERDIGAYLQDADELCAMVLIDIDHFKAVNDNLGHAYGDRLLMNISATLRSVLRREDYVARIGGDEFIVFFHEISDRHWVETKVQQLVGELKQSIADDKQSIGVSASVGIAYTSRAADAYDDLYHNADVAMYKAKQAGGDRFAVYTGNAFQPVRFGAAPHKE